MAAHLTGTSSLMLTCSGFPGCAALADAGRTQPPNPRSVRRPLGFSIKNDNPDVIAYGRGRPQQTRAATAATAGGAASASAATVHPVGGRKS